MKSISTRSHKSETKSELIQMSNAEDQTPRKLWHYTTGEKLELIQADGVITQSPHVSRGERRAVWFSSNPVWELTAAKGRIDPLTGRLGLLNMAQHVELCGGLVRIGVAPEIAPHDWNAFRGLSGISAKIANCLRQEAFQRGARPSEWFVTFDSVPRTKWLCIEMWVDGQWGIHPAWNALKAVAA